MSLNTLNESLDIIANLVIPRLEDDVDVIQKLDDEPNDVGGLTAAELKAKFDEAANIIKTYLNETLVPQLSDTVAEAEVRAQAEAERIANERARVEAENLREEAEDAREENEDARVQAEEARVSAESGRVAAESSRSSAESTRQNNEQERQSQESTRQANEETRQSQESTRQTNEQTRQTQEQARATAEAQRAAAEATRRNTFATELSQAQTARSAAEAAAKAADEDAQYVEETKDLSKSWAVGGTGTREGEDTNNAMYWSERAKNYAGGGVNSFNGRNGAVVPKTGDYTAEQVGADPKGTADAKVSEHNTSEASHQDLRLAISDHLTDKNNPHNVTAEQVGAIAAGAVGNVHVWQRVQSGVTDYLTSTDPNAYPKQSAEGGQDASYVLGDVVSGSFYIGSFFAGSNSAVQYMVSDTPFVDESGSVGISNGTTVTFSNSLGAPGTESDAIAKVKALFAGKYVMRTNNPETDSSTMYYTLLPKNEVVYIPDDISVSVLTTITGSPNSMALSKYQPVIGHAAIPANTVITYLGQLGAQPSAEEIGAATTQDFTVPVTDAWDAVPDRGYSQRVSISGIESSDNPIIDVVLGSDIAANALYLEAYALVTRVSTSNGAVTLWCDNDTPTVAFTIQMKVVR